MWCVLPEQRVCKRASSLDHSQGCFFLPFSPFDHSFRSASVSKPVITLNTTYLSRLLHSKLAHKSHDSTSRERERESVRFFSRCGTNGMGSPSKSELRTGITACVCVWGAFQLSSSGIELCVYRAGNLHDKFSMCGVLSGLIRVSCHVPVNPRESFALQSRSCLTEADYFPTTAHHPEELYSPYTTGNFPRLAFLCLHY